MKTEPGSLLIVDDNDVNCRMLSLCFAERGYQVTIGHSGDEALALLQQDTFDLVMLDIMMPGTNGFAVLQALRRVHSPTALPVIMATAYDRSEDVVRALELGANDYVVKPYDFPVILARAQTQLSLKRTMEQRAQLERSLAQQNEELEVANRNLGAAYRRMKRDLLAAARIQESLLPNLLPQVPGVRAAWKFKPCEELGGDTLNLFPLDQDHVALYLLDVSGHGVAAALLSVTLGRILSPTRDPASILVRSSAEPPGYRVVPPAEVAEYLSRRFPFNPDTEQYFTIVYGILNLQTGCLRYVSAGHPGPVLLSRGEGATTLDGSSLPIGISDGPYQEQTVHLEPGDRFYLYSDGITEATNAAGAPFGKRRLLAALQGQRGGPVEEGLAVLLREVQGWCEPARLQDDVSLVGLEFIGTASNGGDSPPRYALAQA